MSNKHKHGGSRSNSGRKPVEDKKIRLTIWIKQSIISANGGLERSKKMCSSILEQQREF